MIKKALTLLAIFVLNGCANHYTLDGNKYESKESFHQAVDRSNSDALSNIKPLPAPLTKKNLIVAIPSESVLYGENINRITKTNGRVPAGLQLELIENLTKGNYNMSKVFFDAIQKRGIYTTAKFINMPSMAVSIEPSADADVLYFSKPSINTGQWFFASHKHGKQVFAYDRSGAGASAKVQSFVDAVQTQAIRE